MDDAVTRAWQSVGRKQERIKRLKNDIRLALEYLDGLDTINGNAAKAILKAALYETRN
ncbi:MAG: hypothetical protein WDA42_08295 [Candidatus Bathyarchaeia archaeon]